MDYSLYTDRSTSVKEYMFNVSDGVSLKIIDFTPQNVAQGKPVILFVAGWISLINGWKDVLKVLTAEHRVIYLESREKQSSTIPYVKKVSFSMDRLKLDIGEVIEKIISPEKFILTGSSLGASAILEYCGSEKLKPLSAVLIGPNAEFRFPKILGTIIPVIHPSLYFAVKPLIKWYLRNFRLDKKNSKEQIEKYENTLDCADPYKLKANALAIRNYAIWDHIANISVPCLIISGTTDTLHDTEDIKHLIKILPDSTYIELKSNMETHSEKAGRIIVEYIQR
ncbi:MAG: alpha/beta hydrolase [Deltaproteobacteria bacterium]|nr:alpha/beta hydrolase [Deltaproteobacteria bacterium]